MKTVTGYIITWHNTRNGQIEFEFYQDQQEAESHSEQLKRVGINATVSNQVTVQFPDKK